MDDFNLLNEAYACEGVPLKKLAETVGTPAYIYSEATLRRHCRRFIHAFSRYPTLACFAVKASSNLSILKTIFSEGFGADLVSQGELERSLKAGVEPQCAVFSGVGKLDSELMAALSAGILMFNVESPDELERLAATAKTLRKTAKIALRINPNIDAKTNEKIATGLYSTKFGLPEGDLPELLSKLSQDPHLELTALACHIGSQITDISPLKQAAGRMADLAKSVLALGHKLEFLNMGGGLGIRYQQEQPPTLEAYADALIDCVEKVGLKLIVEPGRVLVGNTAVLLTRVVSVKRTPERHFAVVDAAMNDLIRPTLYGSFHEILPVEPRTGSLVTCDFVGPICETGDFLGKERKTAAPAVGDLYFVRSAGAYAASMASQYNSRPRAPEVLVHGKQWRIIRPRETHASLWDSEVDALTGGG